MLFQLQSLRFIIFPEQIEYPTCSWGTPYHFSWNFDNKSTSVFLSTAKWLPLWPLNYCFFSAPTETWGVTHDKSCFLTGNSSWDHKYVIPLLHTLSVHKQIIICQHILFYVYSVLSSPNSELELFVCCIYNLDHCIITVGLKHKKIKMNSGMEVWWRSGWYIYTFTFRNTPTLPKWLNKG